MLELGLERTDPMKPSSLNQTNTKKWHSDDYMKVHLLELKRQMETSFPLMAMNLMWFSRIAITTAFLGQLGQVELVGGTLAFTFANVTGFSIMCGLASAMQPICGQAYGAKNFKLLHKTLVMAISLLLVTSLPIAFLWLNVDTILLYFGQQEDISRVAKIYLLYLLPVLVFKSFIWPLREYLNAQSLTVPIMFSSAVTVAAHVPINMVLSKSMGLEGVAIAIWLSDVILATLLASYMVISENCKSGIWKEGGWWDQGIQDWVRMLRLCGPSCLTTCLEWWCYEILILVTGWLGNAKQAVGVLAIILNFDYLVYSINVSLGTCASIRVSNELGANRAGQAYRAAYVALLVSAVLSCIGGLATIAARGEWGALFSHDEAIIKDVKKTMILWAMVEVVNFPLAVCGGIVRGTGRPRLGMYANLVGFYLLALPLGAFLAFKLHLGLGGLLIGFLCGVVACLVLLLVSIARIDWLDEAHTAQKLTCQQEEEFDEDNKYKNSEVETVALL